MRKILVLATALLMFGGGVAHADIDHPTDPGGLRTATRLNPQPKQPVVPVLWTTESANGRCTGLITALEYWNPGWNVDHMAAIAYRESRCVPTASNSCCSGMFQVHRIWIEEAAMCGITSRADLYDGWKNVCAASVIFREQGMSAWAQTR